MTSKARDLADLLSDGAVGTNEIANGAVTEGKLGNGAVTEGKLGNGAVTADKLAAGAVTVDKVPNSSITLNKLSTSGTPANTNFLRGDGQWQVPPAGFSGTENITSSTDVQLTAANKQVININMTEPNRFVILPDATTATAGSPAFYIQNTGVYSFTVRTFTGEDVSLNVGTFNGRTLTLLRNNTQGGLWVPVNTTSPLVAAPVGAVMIDSVHIDSSIQMSPSTCLGMRQVSTTGTSTVIEFRVGTISASGISWGPASSTFTFTSGGLPSLFQTGDNTVIANYSLNTGTGGRTTTRRLRAIRISGSSVSVGSEVTLRSFSSAANYSMGQFTSVAGPLLLGRGDRCLYSIYNFQVNYSWTPSTGSLSTGVLTVNGDNSITITQLNTNQYIGGAVYVDGDTFIGSQGAVAGTSSTVNGLFVGTFASGSLSTNSVNTGVNNSIEAPVFAFDGNTLRTRSRVITRSGTSIVSSVEAQGTLLSTVFLGNMVFSGNDAGYGLTNQAQIRTGLVVSGTSGSFSSGISNDRIYKLTESTFLFHQLGNPQRYRLMRVY